MPGFLLKPFTVSWLRMLILTASGQAGALCGVLAILLVSTTGPMMESLRWFVRRRWTHEQGSSVEIVQTGSLFGWMTCMVVLGMM
ncbi:hypothetical protein NL676_018146 [Syzygium grande]|nr:hypothetical protein NL676_018146 [Syzygium grande]